MLTGPTAWLWAIWNLTLKTEHFLKILQVFKTSFGHKTTWWTKQFIFMDWISNTCFWITSETNQWGPDESCFLMLHFSLWKVCRQVHNPAPWKHRFWVCSLRSMGIAVTCNYFTVTCEEHPNSASSCREPSLSPASRCSWISCSSQLSDTHRSLVDLSPLMNSRCDLQGPEAEVPSVRILTAWGTHSQVDIRLHRQWPSKLWMFL